MSAFEVKDKLVGAINTQEYDFIVVNFANGDMVGHTGVYNAIAKAVWAVDHCVKEVVEAAKANDYETIIIADHGNADNAINEDGSPNTAHSLNPVPFIYVTNNNFSIHHTKVIVFMNFKTSNRCLTNSCRHTTTDTISKNSSHTIMVVFNGFADVVSGSVTTAVRDTTIDGLEIHENDNLGMVE